MAWRLRGDMSRPGDSVGEPVTRRRGNAAGFGLRAPVARPPLASDSVSSLSDGKKERAGLAFCAARLGDPRGFDKFRGLVNEPAADSRGDVGLAPAFAPRAPAPLAGQMSDDAGCSGEPPRFPRRPYFAGPRAGGGGS